MTATDEMLSHQFFDSKCDRRIKLYSQFKVVMLLKEEKRDIIIINQLIIVLLKSELSNLELKVP